MQRGTGKLAENIIHFGRVLRQAGVPVGPGTVMDALEAVNAETITHRDDFYWTLHSVMIKNKAHSVLFDQAFHVFWRKPKMLEQMMQMFFQQISMSGNTEKPKQAGYRRLANAMFDQKHQSSMRDVDTGAIEVEATYTASDREVLRAKDFEQMSSAEESAARRAIARMRLKRVELPTRRFETVKGRGLIDMRATLRASMKSGGAVIDLKFKKPKFREPPLVVLLDISGSMTNYSRMLLHFLHALMSDRDRVQVFVFGTRLTNITRQLDRRDVDEALSRVSGAVDDWSGGTRIGEALREFNYKWARRVLAQNAHVLLMSDGLERDEDGVLEVEMARLHRAAKRLVWLNPLLRFDGFEALASGVRTIMAHVDEFRPVHNLESLDELAQALAGSSKAAHTKQYRPANWLKREA
ncbi:carbon monoxide dehydrogenase E protein [hydrothermal vent metagenome]|uniref:Carbon monoxide dehydrogenase E protein n=1 Tax=hydrothermal vent metagenome TaxID=652676 RepID=A0A3B0RT47_9ZZZZ